MKYSLRSLMIVVTLACAVVGGRIEYLRRWALYHENQASTFRPAADSGAGFLVQNHDAHALAYRRAMWRPWTVIDESPGMNPPTGPLKFAHDLAWLAFLAVLAVAWWFDRRGLMRRVEALEKAASP